MDMRSSVESGRVYLLTGVTGFLGKVVLEELLRRREALGVARVYVLIRPKPPVGAAERFRSEVASSECFARLPAGWTRTVTVVHSTLEEPGLDLDPVVRSEITGQVTHVIHAAASVEFDLPLDAAARANVGTTLNVLELARSCPSLRKLVCVSTAYATPRPGDGTPIEETLAPLPRPAEEIYDSILDGRAVTSELLAQTGHPNTYTLTKALMEHLLVSRGEGLPLAIVRPSIISASRRHPFPGWIDSAAGYAAFAILLGLGRMRAVIADPEARLDLMPVDEVATRILLACEADARDGGAPSIHHAVAGLEHSARVAECWNAIHDFFSLHRVDRRPGLRHLGPPGLRFTLMDTVYQRLGIAAAALFSERARKSGGQLRARLARMNRAFPYFTCQSFDFRSSRPLDDAFDPRAYVETVNRGVYRHILGRDDTQWVLAGRRHRGHGGDARWVIRQPRGNAMIRLAAWLSTKVLRRCFDRVTVDLPSFEAARKAAPDGAAIAIVPSHRSYFDFVLCSYLFFARPDLGITIPHIAAAIEFGNIRIVGRLLNYLHAFYIRRGLGREDHELTRQVHHLVRNGCTLEFFIEGQRSRSREFLPPKRGLLRCIQSTGETFTVLPVTASFDRVPEEAAFAQELAGAPKPKMRLGPLLGWVLKVFRGEIDLGQAHLRCGAPLHLDPETDVHALSQEVIAQLQAATVSTTYHLRSFLEYKRVDGIDVAWLRSAIEERGGRVLESHLQPAKDLDPIIVDTFRHQFAHLFQNETASDEPLRSLLSALAAPDAGEVRQTLRVEEPVA